MIASERVKKILFLAQAPEVQKEVIAALEAHAAAAVNRDCAALREQLATLTRDLRNERAMHEASLARLRQVAEQRDAAVARAENIYPPFGETLP